MPVEKQTAGGDISKLVTGFPGLKIFNCDGTDFIASYATMSDAVEYCRREQTPVLVHASDALIATPVAPLSGAADANGAFQVVDGRLREAGSAHGAVPGGAFGTGTSRIVLRTARRFGSVPSLS